MHQDHLGGIIATTNTTGSTIASREYYAFGETRSSSGTLSTDKQFTGQRLDATTGLYFYNARYYDPGVGRFASTDLIVPDPANIQDFNRYSYVRNNPLRYNDPSGLVLEFEDAQLSRAVSAVLASDDPLLADAQSLIVKLMADEYVYHITWGDISGGFTHPVTRDITIEITLKRSGLSHQTDIQVELAGLIVHEMYHASDTQKTDSVQEELTAYHYQYDVRAGLGKPYSGEDPISRLRPLDPSDQSDLANAKQIMSEAPGFRGTSPGYFYRQLPLTPARGFGASTRNAWRALQQVGALLAIWNATR